MKKLILLCFIVFSCSQNSNPYYDYLKGEWQINSLNSKSGDIKLDDYFLLGFEKNNHFWILKNNYKHDFISADYKIFKQNDTMRIALKNCADQRFEGVYDLYLDTISRTSNQYILQVAFDSYDMYFSAVRPRSKQ